MRIIHVTDSSVQNFDGIATYINELIICSEKEGDDIMLICTTPTDRSNLRPLNYKGIVKACKSLRFPGKPKFIFPIKTGIGKMIRDFEPDLIWIHTVGTIGTAVAKIAKGKYDVIYTKHSFDGELWCLYLKAPKAFQWLINFAADQFEKSIAKACSFIVYHINDIHKVENKSYYHKFSKFLPPIQTRFLENRTEKPLEKNQLVVGFCGRCEPDKGIEDTYIGLTLFKEKHPEIDVVFYLIGDGPVAQTLPSKYATIKTVVTGYVNDVVPYLDKLDGFILSSKHETISLSTLEAYSRGIPIFSLPIGYLSEIKDIDNFYLFENNTQLVKLLEKRYILEKTGRKIPEKNNLNELTISFADLLKKVKVDI